LLAIARELSCCGISRLPDSECEATRRIRSNPANKNIPIIAVTSYALSGDEGKAIEAGCDACLAKPYSPRHLLARIREYLPAEIAK